MRSKHHKGASNGQTYELVGDEYTFAWRLAGRRYQDIGDDGPNDCRNIQKDDPKDIDKVIAYLESQGYKVERRRALARDYYWLCTHPHKPTRRLASYYLIRQAADM